MIFEWRVEYTQLLTLASVLIFPVMFPSVFWKKDGSGGDASASRTGKDRPVVMYFTVGKKTENPYGNEPTSLALYDEEDEHAYNIHDVYDNEAFAELCLMLKSRIGESKVVYLVTYDNDFKVASLKTILGDFFEEIDVEGRYVDLKQLFYCTHVDVPKVLYSDLTEYYRVPSLDNRPIEYAALFAQLIRDYDPMIDDHYKDGLEAIYNHVFC